MSRFAILLLALCVMGCAAFDTDRVKLVDSTPPSSGMQNYLFRGAEPLDDGDFAYDIMNSTFHALVPDMPDEYYLVDLSLLNSFELIEDHEEEQFFKRNPHLGTYYRWPIWGQVMVPDFFDEETRERMALDLEQWQHDKLVSGIPMLRDWLYTPKNGTSVVIYFHCDAGKDRTGEIAGSYYQSVLGWTFEEALYFDDKQVENSRNIHVPSRNAMQWYCYYLYYSGLATTGCDLPEFDNCGYLASKCNSTVPADYPVPDRFAESPNLL